MALAQRQPFTPGGDFIVRKAFAFNGEQFDVDDDFIPGEVGVDDRRLRQMYDAGFLRRNLALVGDSDEDEDDTEKKQLTPEEKKAAADARKKARREAKKAAKKK